jgi:hypothetical protein
MIHASWFLFGVAFGYIYQGLRQRRLLPTRTWQDEVITGAILGLALLAGVCMTGGR